MTTFPLRLTLVAASAVVLSACQHMPDFFKRSDTPAATADTTANTTATTAATAPAPTPAAAAQPATVAPVTAVIVESQNRWWERLRVGTLYCDLGASIVVDRLDTEREVQIKWKQRPYVLEKVATTTGAYRYEDKASGMTLIQIPTKTILLNAKEGQRLADECNNDNRPTAAPAAETPTRATRSRTASTATQKKTP
ncbi:MAG: hypothetical protein GAK30_03761 [Paracidovorax wautersii]|uniref:Membrane-bound lysozyme-inhibitor of c-type lysozyme n=1 Tax=Paracidovorax wautersii TaxID=1177982 RepID=A0A7V8FKI9_9BURK|nr:MAG: hypothetical protein GAK30_03761 [Paracidovorax wautersii]